jgi:hypothetical protein
MTFMLEALEIGGTLRKKGSLTGCTAERVTVTVPLTRVFGVSSSCHAIHTTLESFLRSLHSKFEYTADKRAIDAVKHREGDERADKQRVSVREEHENHHHFLLRFLAHVKNGAHEKFSSIANSWGHNDRLASHALNGSLHNATDGIHGNVFVMNMAVCS